MVEETINKILDPATSLDERADILVRQILIMKAALKFSIDHGLELNARDQKAKLRGLADAYFIFTGAELTEDKLWPEES